MTDKKIIIAIAATFGITILSLQVLGSFSENAIANALKGLDANDRAQSILVKIKADGLPKELEFSTFSKIGFVKGNAEFLLESIPSKDKKSFYEIVQKSVSTSQKPSMDVSIEIFAGDGTILEQLNYKRCFVESYFVYVNDSKGKFSFVEDKDVRLEIRDVAKFSCISFSIEV